MRSLQAQQPFNLHLEFYSHTNSYKITPFMPELVVLKCRDFENVSDNVHSHTRLLTQQREQTMVDLHDILIWHT